MVLSRVPGFVPLQITILICCLCQGYNTVPDQFHLRSTRAFTTVLKKDVESPISFGSVEHPPLKSGSHLNDSPKDRLATRGLFDSFTRSKTEAEELKKPEAEKSSGWFSSWSRSDSEKKLEATTEKSSGRWLGGLLSSQPATVASLKNKESSDGWTNWLTGGTKPEESAPSPKPEVKTRSWGWFGSDSEEKKLDSAPAPKLPREVRKWCLWRRLFGGGSEENKPKSVPIPVPPPAPTVEVSTSGLSGRFNNDSENKITYYGTAPVPAPVLAPHQKPEVLTRSWGGWFGRGQEEKRLDAAPIQAPAPVTAPASKHAVSPLGWGGWLRLGSEVKKSDSAPAQASIPASASELLSAAKLVAAPALKPEISSHGCGGRLRRESAVRRSDSARTLAPQPVSAPKLAPAPKLVPASDCASAPAPVTDPNPEVTSLGWGGWFGGGSEEKKSDSAPASESVPKSTDQKPDSAPAQAPELVSAPAPVTDPATKPEATSLSWGGWFGGGSDENKSDSAPASKSGPKFTKSTSDLGYEDALEEIQPKPDLVAAPEAVTASAPASDLAPKPEVLSQGWGGWFGSGSEQKNPDSAHTRVSSPTPVSATAQVSSPAQILASTLVSAPAKVSSSAQISAPAQVSTPVSAPAPKPKVSRSGWGGWFSRRSLAKKLDSVRTPNLVLKSIKPGGRWGYGSNYQPEEILGKPEFGVTSYEGFGRKSSSPSVELPKNRLTTRGLFDGFLSPKKQEPEKSSSWFSSWSKSAPESKPEPTTDGTNRAWLGGLFNSKPSDSTPVKSPNDEESSGVWKNWLISKSKVEEPATNLTPKIAGRGWGWFGGKSEEKKPGAAPASDPVLKPTVSARGWGDWLSDKPKETQPEPSTGPQNDKELNLDHMLGPDEEFGSGEEYLLVEDHQPEHENGPTTEPEKESSVSSGWFGGGSKKIEAAEGNQNTELKAKAPDSGYWWGGSNDPKPNAEKKNKKPHGPLRSFVKSVEHMIVPKPVRKSLKAIPGVQPTRRAWKSGLDAVDVAVDSVTDTDYVKNIRAAGKLSGKRVALRAVNLADSVLELNIGTSEAAVNMMDTLQKEGGRTLDTVSVAVNSAKPAVDFIKSKAADGMSKLKEGNENLRKKGKGMLSAISSKANLDEVNGEAGKPKTEDPSNKGENTNGWFGW